MSDHGRLLSLVSRHMPDFASDRLFRRHVELFYFAGKRPRSPIGRNERLSMSARDRPWAATSDRR